ncbi:hypothetical protein [uncultured Anaerococcus sp.]|uniref:hypothetical protein n=1 Tax=uncultured Anaerococcus sp. TaxID=293428 RepID=UPI0025EDEEE4|nr:hypothetical protein [uncultured Anaerococcus sp.]
MTVRRLTLEDIFKPNYDKKISRRAERRNQKRLRKDMQRDYRKRNWERIRKASLEEFGE